ncbi:unnamed protein product, partial [Bemisia tabaci]
VRVVYDFQGEPNSSELSVTSGEILTVTRQDVGEGWWEGTNHLGRTGLFPAAYVEEVKVSVPPAVPPPPLPKDWETNSNNADNLYCNTQQTYEPVDFWDDDWDDDSESGAPPALPPSNTGISNYTPSISDASSIAGDGKGTINKKSSRFTNFHKAGGDSYIMGTLKVPVPDSEIVRIIENSYGEGYGSVIVWETIDKPYAVMVASPKKDSKFKGLKSFIAYQLTPTFNNIQVSRRYKHFDWLHERLEEKFSLIPIPPLPDKQISGRYDEQFIERRKNQLQAFVSCVCRHPVLSRCKVWEHFITCTDEKLWKDGKRKAEKDKLLGANYFLAVKAPEKALNPGTLDQDTESCSRYIHSLDGAAKNLFAVAGDQSKKNVAMYKREFQKVGHAFYSLGQVLGTEERTGYDRSSITAAIKKTGDTYNDIGKLFEEQAKLDWEPLGDTLHILKGITASFPEMLTVHKGAIQKKKECEKLYSEQKMDHDQLAEVSRRTDTVSYALLAEINYFHADQTAQLNESIKSFLTEQITFYQKVVVKLQEALHKFEE